MSQATSDVIKDYRVINIANDSLIVLDSISLVQVNIRILSHPGMFSDPPGGDIHSGTCRGARVVRPGRSGHNPRCSSHNFR